MNVSDNLCDCKSTPWFWTSDRISNMPYLLTGKHTVPATIYMSIAVQSCASISFRHGFPCTRLPARAHRYVGSYWSLTGPTQVLRDLHLSRTNDRTGVPKPVRCTHARVRTMHAWGRTMHAWGRTMHAWVRMMHHAHLTEPAGCTTGSCDLFAKYRRYPTEHP